MCGSGSCGACKLLRGLVALVLTLTTIAAFVAVWRTHVVGGNLTFGSTEQSLALLTLIFSSTMWLKVVKKMCPCSKGGCGCGGGGCMCSKCGCPGGKCVCGDKPMMGGKMR